MIKSIKSNLLLYGIFGVFGIFFVFYLMAYNKLDWSAVLGFLVAIANCL